MTFTVLGRSIMPVGIIVVEDRQERLRPSPARRRSRRRSAGPPTRAGSWPCGCGCGRRSPEAAQHGQPGKMVRASGLDDRLVERLAVVPVAVADEDPQQLGVLGRLHRSPPYDQSRPGPRVQTQRPRGVHQQQVGRRAEPLRVARELGRLDHDPENVVSAPRKPMKTTRRASALSGQRLSKRPNRARRETARRRSRPACPKGTAPAALHEAGEAGPAERARGAGRRQQQQSGRHASSSADRGLARHPQREEAPPTRAEPSRTGEAPGRNASLIATRTSRVEPPLSGGASVVGDVGIEPTTSCLSSRRSPN